MPLSSFHVIGPHDTLLFSYGDALESSDESINRQFMVYAALDSIEDIMWSSSELYFPKVDRPSEEKYCISAYIGFAPVKLIVLQDCDPKEQLVTFFQEAHSICARYLMSPFFSATQTMESAHFRNELAAVCNKYL